MGNIKTKAHPRLSVDMPLSRRGFQALLRKAPTHSITLKSLGVLGSTQREISQNLTALIGKVDSIRISSPRLTVNRHTATLLKSIRLTELQEVSKRKTVSRIVFAIVSQNANALTRPAVQTLEVFQQVSILRSEGKSYCAISRALSEQGIRISRSSIARILRLPQILQRKEPL